LLFNRVLEDLASPVRHGKELKGTETEKEEIKLFLDNVIVYLENLKESTGNLLELNEFSKVTGYKINIQKINPVSTY